jgi:hypothetical protein
MNQLVPVGASRLPTLVAVSGDRANSEEIP